MRQRIILFFKAPKKVSSLPIGEMVRTGKRGRVTVIELEAQSRFYSVVTAYTRIPEIKIQGVLIWSGRTVSNTRDGMDALGTEAQPPDSDFRRVGSPEPLAGDAPNGAPKPVLEGLGNQINKPTIISHQKKRKLTKAAPLILTFRSI